MQKKKIIFACGGSGGHSYPLMAVAKEFLAQDSQWECAFVSCFGSLEEKIIPRDGHRLILIPSGKLKGQNPLQTIWSIVQVVLSLFYSLVLVFKEKPDFVFSAGGYAGAPFLVAAALCGVPCGILEQNRIPGLANQWMARFCKIVFLNFEATAKLLPRFVCKTVGHPYRKEITQALWSEAEAPGLWSRNPFHIFVFGGSQGAIGINRLVCAALPQLKGIDIFIHHQTGVQDLETVKAAYQGAEFSDAQVEAYVYDMQSAYKAAHLVICRAGASSLAELAAAGKATLLIPLVSKDRHQEHNARELEQLGAAACFLQGDLSGSKLAELVKGYYHDRQLLQNFAKNIRQMDHPKAAQEIAQQIKESTHA